MLNTSLHSGCARPPQASCVRPRALMWLEKMRGSFDFKQGKKSVYEKFFLHATSAGNFRSLPTVDDKDGKLNSQYTAANLLTGLTTSTGTAVPNTTNTLVVENRVNTAVPFTPGCLVSSSKQSGDISGVGTKVWSFIDATTNADELTGTSMSTPQVAGLAAYIWALNPSLWPEGVIEILRKTSRSYPGDTACAADKSPSPSIDAYAAVLAIDKANILDPAKDAPVRLAIFDVADSSGNKGTNRAFDSHDVSRFKDMLDALDGTSRDYSRFDLNGDGLT